MACTATTSARRARSATTRRPAAPPRSSSTATPPSVLSAGCVADCNVCTPDGTPSNCLMNWAVTWGFKSQHRGGSNFVFVDGSVHFLSENIDHKTYQYLGCRNDGQSFAMP